VRVKQIRIAEIPSGFPLNGQLAPSPGGGDGKIDLIEKFCEV
jgi:hypothetical protein